MVPEGVRSGWQRWMGLEAVADRSRGADGFLVVGEDWLLSHEGVAPSSAARALSNRIYNIRRRTPERARA
jgi:hypothetical protein